MLTDFNNQSKGYYPYQVEIMSQYPLTPPSSNEDSPQPGFHNPSPTYNSSTESIYATHSYALFPSDQPSPFIRILEQPIDKFRFRYKSEMTGTHGSLCGMSSDKSRKQTYPTIELCNYRGTALVRCQIYQVNPHYDDMPHAHRLVRKQGKDEVDDPHDGIINDDTGYIHIFNNMGIIHTAKKNIVPELVRKKSKLRKEEIARNDHPRELSVHEELNIKGLAEDESKSINLNVACLRFDAFEQRNGVLYPLCPPVYSHGINNLKSALTGELKIVRMDHVSCNAKGNKEIFMLVERVTKKNIKIRFYEVDDEENVLWEDYGRFSDLDVHHQYAIVFKAPPYHNLNITAPVTVLIELERPSDKQRSEPKKFRYVPFSDSYKPGAKRPKPNNYSSSYETSLQSDELPATISNLNLDQNYQNCTNDLLGSVDYEVGSEEIKRALDNYGSDDFLKLFEDNREAYSGLGLPDMALDSPLIQNKGGKHPTFKRDERLRNKSSNSRNVLPQDIKKARDVLNELKNFIKSKPGEDQVLLMLKHYFATPNKTNALHTFVKQNDISALFFILKLMYVWKQFDLPNIRSDDYETVLHIATYCKNEEIVHILINFNVDVYVGDDKNNTALHIAVIINSPTEIMEKLLSVADASKLIDSENNDGNTALNIAIENNDLKAFKLLCMRGANINKRHKKSGYTPLRFAVEKENVEMVKYLLQHPDIDPPIEDFQGIDALRAGMRKEDPELVGVVAEYMTRYGYCNIEVKDEDLSDDEEKVTVKTETVTPLELRDMYSRVHDFTPECLDQIANILDKSNSWEHLVDLLDLDHLQRNGLFKTQGSPTKILLKAAIDDSNENIILQIRDFLENLDELKVVEIMDNMVKSKFI